MLPPHLKAVSATRRQAVKAGLHQSLGAARSSLDQFHFSMEAFGDSVFFEKRHMSADLLPPAR